MFTKLVENVKRLYNSKEFLWIIIGLGVILRLVQYLYNRSLWLDESLLALNIVDRTFSELFNPLSYHQGAPIGFLMLEKISVTIFNDGEYALRLVPFLSGIASMFLFSGVAKRFVKPEAVPIALFIFAISEPLIYYSSEVKQYSSDVLIALLTLYFVIKYIQSEKLTLLRIFGFGIFGATVIWFSHPSLFMLAGVGGSLALFSFFRNEWDRIGRLSIVFTIWAFSLTMCYFVSLRGLSKSESLLNYWTGGFMPLPPLSLGDIKWFFDTFFGIFNNPVGLSLSGIAALAFLVGSGSIISNKKERFYFLILPIFFVLLASGVHKYPFKGRLLLFIVPSLIIFIAEGAHQIGAKTRQTAPVIGIAFICLLLLNPSLSAAKNLIKPRTVEEIKPVINYITENDQSGDVLYIYYNSIYAYKYYSKIYNFKNTPYILGVNSRNNWDNYLIDLEKLRGNKRVWILFSHVCTWKGVDEEKLFLNNLNSMGKKLDAFKSTGASVYLYDLSR